MSQLSRQARRAALRRAAKEGRRGLGAGEVVLVRVGEADCDCPVCRAEATGDGDLIGKAFVDLLVRAAAGDPAVFVEFGGGDDDDDDDDDGDESLDQSDWGDAGPRFDA